MRRWEPPQCPVFTWHPGRGVATAQEVEIRIVPIETGTRAELLHTGWERYGSEAAEARAGYDTGWDGVFAPMHAAACRP